MAIFKCKVCGGSLDIDSASSIATCEYCGTKQTLPRLDDERKANLYDRASHFRRNNEFDAAMSIYEQILAVDNTDSESYWSLVLCRYGIEYVEDPTTHKHMPTVNRAQFASIFSDEDYISTIKYADGLQRIIYEQEARAIDEVQKGILSISKREDPFDIFICYKETDALGRRTLDSVLATDIYNKLTREGYRVFLSRITLEDKLGQEYEPYIFAALNSARVMLVLGTKKEYFEAVWVKNEWARYLALVKNGENKTIIPMYRDMDPYDMPTEFAYIQAQDMSKIGFEQDLIRGIKKIISPKVSNDPKATSEASSKAAALLKRAFMALADGEFERADLFCEQVLNYDPENARAYLGKLMAELKIKKQDQLAYSLTPFDSNKNYQKALHFCKGAWVADLMDSSNRAKNRSLESIYSLALKKKTAECDNIQTKIESIMQAIELFERIPEYKDSAAQIMECKTLKLRYEDALELKRRDQIKYDMMMERYNKNAKIIKGLWGFGIGLVLLAAVAFFVIFTYVL